ncbi:hypothetical protein A3K73_00145 [Candidatus Pacearchaeota archaeon RBG_13_36_9]|nr:MAG: hypothetical protein A3K73_00145 [Candidatus Pacearchaeota archaeon RBG_13_36_9]
MGKNKAIKSLGNILSNLAIHKILVRYTNKPESLHHLESEIIAYIDTAWEQAGEFNWSDSDVEEIRSEVLTDFKRDIKRYYPDVRFTMEEAETIVEELLEEVLRKSED